MAHVKLHIPGPVEVSAKTFRAFCSPIIGHRGKGFKVNWGSPIQAEQIEARLATGQFDALTLIHNETSTGVMSPLDQIAALKDKFPEVMFIVDAVSSMTAVKLEFDALRVDVLLAGTQK